ncbi:dihydrofolate reductase, partial [Salmonella enterica]|uniref:dihydrofolate reductase n=1 Tax=Salmonella enterica TaxID=28901 RepID=UPI003D29674B
MQIAYASPGADEIFIGGGASLYEWALPRAKKLYSTVIYNAYDGDTFFPEGLETHFPTPTESEAVEENGVHYVMQTRHRIGPT